MLRPLVGDCPEVPKGPRLAGSEVPVQAIREGVALMFWHEAYAYAESFDESLGRYRGLRGGQMVSLSAESAGLLVKPDVAQRQMDADTPIASPGGGAGGGGTAGGGI